MKSYTVTIPFLAARLDLTALAGSIILYTAFALYLYLPHLSSFDPWRRVFIGSSVIAATGTFILAGRWVKSFIACCLGGLLYAFGPFSLGFALYHPLASTLLAAVPWLFLPAAFWPHSPSRKTALISGLLMLLPFAGVILFFAAASLFCFYPIPIGQRLHIQPFIGLLSPLAAGAGDFPILNFYHVAAAPLVFGLFLFFRLHRIGAIIVFSAGLCLGLWASLGHISPIAWAAIPVLCLGVIAGLGLNGLVLATESDSIWLIITAVITAALATVCSLLSAGYGHSLAVAAGWYMLAAIAVFVIIILAHTKRQFHWLRWAVLSVLLAADIFFTAQNVIDRLF